MDISNTSLIFKVKKSRSIKRKVSSKQLGRDITFHFTKNEVILHKAKLHLATNMINHYQPKLKLRRPPWIPSPLKAP